METEKKEHDKKVKEVLESLKGLKIKEGKAILFEVLKKLEEAIY